MADKHHPLSARFVGALTQCSTKQMIFVVTIFLNFSSLSDCNAHFNTSVDNNTVDSIRLSSSLPNTTASAILNASEEDYLDYYDYEDSNSTGRGHWRRRDNSQIAQVVVYCSVILISLGGILLKYFVTQYETSQIKAQEQLSYHRLQNQVA